MNSSPRGAVTASRRYRVTFASVGIAALWVGVCLLPVPAPAQPEAAPTPSTTTHLEQGRSAAQQLGAALKQALTGAIAEGGPVAAIEVCRLEAPAIAKRLSIGASVGRTALRVRNPENRARDDERAVLERFSRQLAAGESANALEDYMVLADGSARYMKAIPTQPMCLTCHGSVLAPAVAAAIQHRYPSDEATGFAPGSLRGAFVVRWPTAEPDDAP